MTKYARRLILLLTDAFVINIATVLSLTIRFEFGTIPDNFLNVYFHKSIITTLLSLVIYYLIGLYRSLWQNASIEELFQIFFATLLGEAATLVFGLITGLMYPRSTYIIAWLIMFIMIGASRLSIRLGRRIKRSFKAGQQGCTRIMVIGAGEAGSMVIKELKNHNDLNALPVVAIDDDRTKHRAMIHGVPVYGGRNRIQQATDKFMIDEIIIAIPSAPRKIYSEILNICKQTKCKLKTLPGVYEIINERVSIEHIRDVNIEDLLGRDEVKLDMQKTEAYLKGETILVTGGGGSIGSELCRQIARFNPKRIVIFDVYENNAYDLQNELRFLYKDKINLDVAIGSVRDLDRLEQVFKEYKPSIVYHAAAHKHVPLMEENPGEAVKNNVLGTLNTALCADKYGVKRFVMISTDKAVNPTNIMGATKRLAEMIVQSLDKSSKTKFVAVRFGNVLGSNGSVIPLFKKQIAQGGPVTITDPEIIRYFMTIPEAAKLVIQAGSMATGGEVFILDMGEPVKILDLATDLIRLSGLEPNVDIDIKFTGLRPGEKLYEELLLEEEGISKTDCDKIYIGNPLDLSFNEVLLKIKSLESNISDPEKLRECMEKVVPTYNTSSEKRKHKIVGMKDTVRIYQ